MVIVSGWKNGWDWVDVEQRHTTKIEPTGKLRLYSPPLKRHHGVSIGKTRAVAYMSPPCLITVCQPCCNFFYEWCVDQGIITVNMKGVTV